MKEEYTVYSCDICGKRNQKQFTRKIVIPAWYRDYTSPVATEKAVDMCDDCHAKFIEVIDTQFASCNIGYNDDFTVKKRF